MSTSLPSNPANTAVRYTIFVDDNFHYMDEDERYTQGCYDGYETAVSVCKAIVDDYLRSAHEPGMTAEALYGSYCMFGEDPWISPTPEGVERFSAWGYAKHRAEEICVELRATPADILTKDSPAPSPDETATAHRLRAADGLLDLGAPSIALQELEPLDAVTGIQEQWVTSHRVQALGMLEGPAAAGPPALRAVEDERASYTTWEHAIIEALNLGQNALVIQLVERFIGAGHEPNGGVWHNLAAAQTQLGQHELALTSISKALDDHYDPVWCLLDAHLASLWHQLADGNFSLETALTLTKPVFAKLASAARSERGMRPLCWHTAHLHLPPEIVGHMGRDRRCNFHLSTGAPREIRRRYIAWLDNRRHRMARVLERAIRRAHHFLLERQGQWAVEAAARGDWFAVRYHVVLALAQRAVSVDECRNHPGLSCARWMLESIYEAEDRHPGFCKLTNLIACRASGEARQAHDKLERLPASVKITPLYKLRAASLWDELGSHEQAIRLWTEVTEDWPLEPTAFANLMNIHCTMGRWELAEEVLKRLPPSFSHLSDAALRRERVQSRLEYCHYGTGSCQPFCGQPDLGGLIALPCDAPTV